MRPAHRYRLLHRGKDPGPGHRRRQPRVHPKPTWARHGLPNPGAVELLLRHRPGPVRRRGVPPLHPLPVRVGNDGQGLRPHHPQRHLFPRRRHRRHARQHRRQRRHRPRGPVLVLPGQLHRAVRQRPLPGIPAGLRRALPAVQEDHPAAGPHDPGLPPAEHGPHVHPPALAHAGMPRQRMVRAHRHEKGAQAHGSPTAGSRRSGPS